MARGYRKTLGDWGEEVASDYLEKLGYKILARNFFTRFGELDLVAIKDHVLYFVEVKTRSNNSFGFGELAVTEKKLQALEQSILVYLEEVGDTFTDWQIDAIIVEGKEGDTSPKILHFENLGKIEE